MPAIVIAVTVERRRESSILMSTAIYAKGCERSRRVELLIFFFQAEDGIRDYKVTGVQTCALPISATCRPSRSRATPSTGAATCSPAASCSGSWSAARSSSPATPITPSWRRCASGRSEEHTSELQSPCNLVCRLLLEKKNKTDQARLVMSIGRRSAAVRSEQFRREPPITLFGVARSYSAEHPSELPTSRPFC